MLLFKTPCTSVHISLISFGDSSACPFPHKITYTTLYKKWIVSGPHWVSPKTYLHSLLCNFWFFIKIIQISKRFEIAHTISKAFRNETGTELYALVVRTILTRKCLLGASLDCLKAKVQTFFCDEKDLNLL